MKQQGFSLIEILCSQLVLAMAMLGLSSGLSSAGIAKAQVQQTDHGILVVQDIQGRVDLVVDSYGYLETASPVLEGRIQHSGLTGESYDWQLSPLDLRQLHGQSRPLLAKPTGCITLLAGRASTLLQWSALQTSISATPQDFTHCPEFDPALRLVYLGT